MNVLMTMNWRVFRKKVTTGTMVELDSSGTNLNANVRNMIMNTIADLSQKHKEDIPQASTKAKEENASCNCRSPAEN